MYNEVTKECACNRCSYSWRSRGDAPRVCPSCTSKLWNSGARKFEVIISKILPGEEGQHKFGIIPFVDKPSVESTDVFFITPEDYSKYFYGTLSRTRCKIGSAIIFIGDFELGEDLILKINECKLIYAHSQGIGREYVDDACIYNIKSFYEQKKAEQLRKLEAERQAALEEKKRQERLQAALKMIEEQEARKQEIENAKATLYDEAATDEEKLRAVSFLERA